MDESGFGKDEIKIELKRMVQHEESRALEALNDIEAKTMPGSELIKHETEEKVQKLRQELEINRSKIQLRFKRVLDFIDGC